MNTYKFQQVAICLCVSMAFLLPQKYASVQDLNFVEIPLETFHDEKPVGLSGLISSQTLNIPVPQSWLLGEGNWLELKLAPSPLLNLAKSSLTISLNGLQIGSYNLRNVPKTKQRIHIPANMFTQGNNIYPSYGMGCRPIFPISHKFSLSH